MEAGVDCEPRSSEPAVAPNSRGSGRPKLVSHGLFVIEALDHLIEQLPCPLSDERRIGLRDLFTGHVHDRSDVRRRPTSGGQRRGGVGPYQEVIGQHDPGTAAAVMYVLALRKDPLGLEALDLTLRQLDARSTQLIDDGEDRGGWSAA